MATVKRLNGNEGIFEGCVAEGLFSTDVIRNFLKELLKYSRFFLGYKQFFSLPLLVQLLTLGQLCQTESENKILHKFIDMTTENVNVELRKAIT